VPGYKRLKAAAQNYIHSFLSAMNFVDDEYISFEIKRAFLNSKSKTAELDMMDIRKSDPIFHTSRILKSFGYYKSMLADQVRKQNGDPEKIVELKVRLTKDKKYGLTYTGHMIDDRGKKTELKVIWI
jgi:hypothetical protein